MIDVRNVLSRATDDNASVLLRNHRVAVKRQLIIAMQYLGGKGVDAYDAQDDILLDYVDAQLVRMAERSGLIGPSREEQLTKALDDVIKRNNELEQELSLLKTMQEAEPAMPQADIPQFLPTQLEPVDNDR